MAGGVAGGFSAPSNFPGGSTVTEFTKRRNWSAKVMEELKDLLQILDSDGRIKFVSPNVQSLTGYSTDEIRDMLLRDLIHPDDVGVFVAEMNESIASGQPLRMFYRFKKRNGSYAIFESVGHAHVAAARFAPNPHNQSPFCQAVFVMSRPYPTRNAALLDSFLEHKMENERLRQRIAELRQEEEAEAEDAGKQWLLHGLDGGSDVTPSENTLGLGSPVGAASAFGGRGGRGGDNGNGNGSGSGNGNDNGTGNGDANASGASGYVDPSMPPPERRPSLNAALTRENLEGAAVGSRPDSLRDKMARYEGAKHAETIEMLTGLRYLDGERSRGITTGNASPALIKGDVGIAISLERDVRTGEKIKKKLKTAEEYVCTDCGRPPSSLTFPHAPGLTEMRLGTLDSPEWRKGPSGPKTLCNACGLRWAKKEKKRHSGHRDSTVEPGMG